MVNTVIELSEKFFHWKHWYENTRIASCLKSLYPKCCRCRNCCSWYEHDYDYDYFVRYQLTGTNLSKGTVSIVGSVLDLIVVSELGFESSKGLVKDNDTVRLINFTLQDKCELYEAWNI